MTAGGDAPFSLVGPDPCIAPLDRADDLRADPDALASRWPESCVLLIDADARAVADAALMPHVAKGGALRDVPGDATFLGLDPGGDAWFASAVPSHDDIPPTRIDLRSAAATWPVREAYAFASAHAIHHWQLRHRFCGTCGGDVEFVRGGWLGRCLRCEREHYPRTDPAVIVAVGQGSKLLMGRQAAWPAGRYSVIAGFVEPGETLEHAVVREVAEETGIRVTRCRYVASQPWPFPSALMLGFIAEAAPGDVRTTHELEHARWFEREEIEAALDAEGRGDRTGPFQLPSRISIGHWLVREWLASQRAD